MAIPREGESARILQVASTITVKLEGGDLHLKPGKFLVEVKPGLIFRVTKDPRTFFLPKGARKILIDTGGGTSPGYQDTGH